ncbi:hypothetical protein SAMN05216359_108172 [Roseateles sp. YR242]|uniref:hypothetical protein n=1 Tax=Roseateles sp. YR242 TaxID=1855305 RepID=UPI0008B1A98E|nr:hypothetical protein [Roseateles sp. YR242]SEL39847.1 hypothetical protein SAMN05216359_108172 [Roseateles sp. YR242]
MNTKDAPPTRAMWGDIEADQDILWAYESFGEKSFVQILPRLESNFLIEVQHLAIIPDLVFSYYAESLLLFVLNHCESEDDFLVNLGAFVDFTDAKLENSPAVWKEFWTNAMELMERCANRLSMEVVHQGIRQELSQRISAICVLIKTWGGDWVPMNNISLWGEVPKN